LQRLTLKVRVISEATSTSIQEHIVPIAGQIALLC